MVAITSGWAAPDTIAFVRFRSRHMATPSAAAEAPSYTEALAASMPVSSQISLSRPGLVSLSQRRWSMPLVTLVNLSGSIT